MPTLPWASLVWDLPSSGIQPALGPHPGPLALWPSAPMLPTPHPRAMSGTANPSGKGEDCQKQSHAGSPAQQHPPRGPRLGFGQQGERPCPHPADPRLGMGGGMHVLKQSHTQVESRHLLFSPLHPLPPALTFPEPGGILGRGFPGPVPLAPVTPASLADRVGLTGVLFRGYPLQHDPLWLSGHAGET